MLYININQIAHRLRELREARIRSGNLPVKTIVVPVVTKDGEIVNGRTLNSGEERAMSQIPPAIDRRTEDEIQIVAEKFPSNTQPLVVDGVLGWSYSFVDRTGQKYEMFAYFDGSLYQVAVAFPEVAGKYGLNEDGTIWLNHQRGYNGLLDVYAKSILWANNFSIFQETGQFPF